MYQVGLRFDGSDAEWLLGLAAVEGAKHLGDFRLKVHVGLAHQLAALAALLSMLFSFSYQFSIAI